MPDWKRVRINFPTVKLGQFIELVKETIAEKGKEDFKTVYGVTNVEGITITGKKASKDISNYIVIDKNYFAYNPYRINVGSIGFNSKGLKGCVSPAYVVFRAKNNLSPGFLYVYLKSEFGNHLINWYGNRGGVRNALRYDDLCDIDIPDIGYKTQIELLNKIDRSKISLNSFSEEITQQLGYLKQLRQRILQEAIEGKLTAKWRAQHHALISGDNHASKLLEKIKTEKERLTKNTKTTKKTKALSPIGEEEKPFDLPAGWVWCRLVEICEELSTGPFGTMLHKSDYVRGGIPVVNPMNIVNGKICADERMRISQKTKERLERYTLKQGDLIIARRGNLSKCAVVQERQDGWLCGTGSFFLRVLCVDKVYFRMAYCSSKSQAYLLQDSVGQTMDNLNQKLLCKLPVALPSIVEQKTIVERVDKLMSMVDELEKQVSERREQSEMLMQSVLREAFAR